MLAVTYLDKVMQSLRCSSSAGRRKERRESSKEEIGEEERIKNPWYIPKT